MIPGFDDASVNLVAAYRAVSPVIGTVLMIVIVVLLASVITGTLLTFDETLEEPEPESIGGQHPWDKDPLLGPEDATAGATDVRYRVYFEITDSDMEGDSLNDVRIFVDTGDDMFSETDQSDLETFEVETVDGTEKEISGDVNDWKTDQGGSELLIGLQGDAYEKPSVGDTIVIVFDGVDNPADPGTYDVEVELNGDGDMQGGTLEIVEG